MSLYDTKLIRSGPSCFILKADPWFFGPLFFVFSTLWAADPLLSRIMIRAGMDGGMCLGKFLKRRASKAVFSLYCYLN